MPYKALKGLIRPLLELSRPYKLSGPYKAPELVGLIRPLKGALEGLIRLCSRGSYKAFRVSRGPSGPYKALEGLIRPSRPLEGH